MSKIEETRTKVNFTNMFSLSFHERRSQKRKMTHNLNCHFYAFGICARKNLKLNVKLTPGFCFVKPKSGESHLTFLPFTLDRILFEVFKPASPTIFTFWRSLSLFWRREREREEKVLFPYQNKNNENPWRKFFSKLLFNGSELH